MLPLQRKQALLAYLTRHGSGSIKELSELLDVSEMTVRRDLKLLEEEGTVMRSHGGAVYSGSPVQEPAFAEKEPRQQERKDRIAAYAAETFVKEQGILILEGGTTVTRMAKFLGEFESLTVLTNGIHTIGQMKSAASRHSILCCGGMFRDVSSTLVGPVAEAFFKQVHADVLFLSASGFTPETGFTDPNMLESQVKKAMREAASRTVLLLDSSKFGQRSFVTTVAPHEADAVITDRDADPAYLDFLRNIGVEVHVVE